MPKTRKFRELYDKMSPRARADVERRVQSSLREMPMYELRAARRLTEQQLARTSGLSQDTAPRMRDDADAYLRTLENFVEAMGGHLELYAEFADGKIRLTSATEDSVRMSLGGKQSKESEGERHTSGKRQNARKYRHAVIAKNRPGPKQKGEPSASDHGEAGR